MSPRLGVILLVTTWFCWGFSYPATGIMLDTVDVWAGRSIVMAVSGVMLLALAYVQGHEIAVPRAHWRDLVIAAVFNMTIFQVAMTVGIHLFSAGRTAVIVYTMPLWAMLFAWPLLGERPGRAQLLALPLGMAGLAVLMNQDFTHLRHASAGALTTLVGAIAFGLGTVLMKRRAWTSNPTVLGGWQLIIGVLPVAVVWAIFAPDTVWAEVSTESWLAIAYLVVIANALAYFSWFRVVSIFPATVSGIGAMAVPVVGIIASAMLVNEAVGWRELVALGLICSAVGINLYAATR